jgi:hypothetical protein
VVQAVSDVEPRCPWPWCSTEPGCGHWRRRSHPGGSPPQMTAAFRATQHAARPCNHVQAAAGRAQQQQGPGRGAAHRAGGGARPALAAHPRHCARRHPAVQRLAHSDIIPGCPAYPQTRLCHPPIDMPSVARHTCTIIFVCVCVQPLGCEGASEMPGLTAVLLGDNGRDVKLADAGLSAFMHHDYMAAKSNIGPFIYTVGGFLFASSRGSSR